MKFKYNVKGVETQGGGKLVKNGVYTIKVTEAPVTQPEGKGVRIEMHAKIQDKRTNDGEFDGTNLRIYYVNLDREDLMWKVAALVEAFGLPEGGSFDDKTLVGKTCRARITSKMDDEWGPQNEIRALLPLEDDADDDEGDEPDESEDEEDDEAEEGGDEDAFGWPELLELDRPALKAFIKDADLGTLKELGITKSTTDEQIQDIIAAALEMGDRPSDDEEPEEDDEAEAEDEEEEDEEDDEAEDEEEEDEEESDGLDELDRAALKKLLKAEVADFTVKKSHSDDDLRAALREARGTGDGEAETPDYDSMDAAALKAECEKRGLSKQGAKPILVKRLQKDDEPF